MVATVGLPLLCTAAVLVMADFCSAGTGTEFVEGRTISVFFGETERTLMGTGMALRRRVAAMGRVFMLLVARGISEGVSTERGFNLRAIMTEPLCKSDIGKTQIVFDLGTA